MNATNGGTRRRQRQKRQLGRTRKKCEILTPLVSSVFIILMGSYDYDYDYDYMNLCVFCPSIGDCESDYELDLLGFIVKVAV